MTQIAGWILSGEIIKSTNVFYPVCLKKYWKKLDNICDGVYFLKVARLHTTAYLKWIRHFARNLRKVLIEVWKDKKTKENMREFLFQIIANELHKLPK